MENAATAVKKLTALIVDDDRLVRMISKATLKRSGVQEVEVAEDGQKAIDLHLEGKFFDVIIMDKDMPFKNGVEATLELRKMGVKAAIVGVTAASCEKERQAFKEAGLDYIYEKPLTKEMVATALAKLADI
ncbi:hypothetical protein ACFE04_031888 [Oxalis oulophora]